jgi:hypothetical protein
LGNNRKERVHKEIIMKTIFLICRIILTVILGLVPLVAVGAIICSPSYPGKGIEVYLIGIGVTLISLICAHQFWVNSADNGVNTMPLRGIWR